MASEGLNLELKQNDRLDILLWYLRTYVVISYCQMEEGQGVICGQSREML